MRVLYTQVRVHFHGNTLPTHGFLDIKPDNVLFHTNMGPEDIASWLRDVVTNADDLDVSHPLPNHPTLTWNCSVDVAKRIKVTLIDMGQGRCCPITEE